MTKFYAVKKGRKTGIFNSWEECQASVLKYPGANFKRFSSEEEAKKYLYESTSPAKDRCYAYIDGSFNNETCTYGYGGFLIDENGDSHTIQGFGKGEMSEMRNVAGEITGATCAIELALELNMTKLTIFYDYQGIETWATGEWKCKNPYTKAYKNYIDSVSGKIAITFQKVKAHSGIKGNENADKLAKEAVGLI